MAADFSSRIGIISRYAFRPAFSFSLSISFSSRAFANVGCAHSTTGANFVGAGKMLILLLRTRLHYYRNYLRHHFDRMVRLEIGLIVAILLFLTVRSPADIGYSLKFLRAENFPLRFARAAIGRL
jgi:hypothetical protein